jgi:hypothetical protein
LILKRYGRDKERNWCDMVEREREGGLTLKPALKNVTESDILVKRNRPDLKGIHLSPFIFLTLFLDFRLQWLICFFCMCRFEFKFEINRVVHQLVVSVTPFKKMS